MLITVILDMPIPDPGCKGSLIRDRRGIISARRNLNYKPHKKIIPH